MPNYTLCYAFPPGNPISCDCTMAWLVRKQYINRISGECHNGTDFEDLNLDGLRGCDGQCPFECVNANISKCISGTVFRSNVAICRSDEVCCKPHKSIPCPSTYTCLNRSDIAKCNSSTEISNTSCPEGEVCCYVETASPTHPLFQHSEPSGDVAISAFQ